MDNSGQPKAALFPCLQTQKLSYKRNTISPIGDCELFTSQSAPPDGLLSLSIKIDRLSAAIEKTDARQQRLNRTPVLLKPANEQSVTPFLTSRRDWKSLNETAEDRCNARELAVANP
jgi:hypothetical protein